MITCEHFVEILMAYLDDELAPDARAAFEEHFKDHCPECEAYLETYQQAIRLGQLCECDGSVPGDVPERLVQAVLAARREEQKGS